MNEKRELEALKEGVKMDNLVRENGKRVRNEKRKQRESPREREREREREEPFRKDYFTPF